MQATAADLAGALPRVGIDGVSILPTLTGAGEQRLRKGLIFENDQGSQLGNPNTDWAIIVGDMKLVKRRDGVRELYDLSVDVGEASPLSLGVQANADLAAELEALAIAEGVTRGDSYGTSYRDWVGGDGDNITSPASWEVTASGVAGGSPDDSWSALLAGAAGGDATAHVTTSVEVLGIEVAGLSDNTQTLLLETGSTLHGRNEVRINTGGRIVLQDGALSTARWIDVLAGAVLAGQGNLAGDVYNQGTVAPGQPADVPFVGPEPPPDPPENITDTPSTLLVFDFSGVQDNNGGATAVGTPLTQTSTLDTSLEIVDGFQTGLGVGFREPSGGTTNAGDEWNINGFGATTLAGAISADDYVGYVVAPVAGLEMLLDEVSFSFWRNGFNAPSDYAILTSIDGFTAAAALAATSIAHAGEGGPDSSSPATLTGAYSASEWLSELAVRLYGWQGAGGNATGNTHFTAASLSGHFRLGGNPGDPTPELNLTGSLSLNGNFYQYAGSEIRIDLGGTDNSDPIDETFDQLIVTGDVELDGNLSLAVAEGFVPVKGDSVSIITAGSLAGQFQAISGMNQAGGGLVFAVTYTPNSVRVTVALPGDVDLDGDVDDADLGTMFSGFTGPGVGTQAWANGDTGGDGDTDDADLGNAFSAFTGPLGPASNVPEPAALPVLVLGGLLLKRRGGRSSKARGPHTPACQPPRRAKRSRAAAYCSRSAASPLGW